MAESDLPEEPQVAEPQVVESNLNPEAPEFVPAAAAQPSGNDDLHGEIMSKLNNIQENLNTTEAELEKLKQNKQSLIEQATALKNQLDQTNNELQASQAALNDLQTSSQSSAESLASEKASLVEQISQLEGVKQQQEDKLRQIIDSINNVNDRIMANNQTLINLNQSWLNGIETVVPSGDNQQVGGGRRYTKWKKMSPNRLFSQYSRSELNKLAKSWGISNPSSYKRKGNLTTAMKLFMHYKAGDINSKKGLYQIAGNTRIKRSKYKTKKGLSKVLNKELSKVKLTNKIKKQIKKK